MLSRSLVVPIVPNWNWNLLRKLQRKINVMFQSYLTGIEIRKLILQHCSSYVPIVPNWNWNRFRMWQMRLTAWVPIVPNWNWNPLDLMLWSVDYAFQSYLTGIEIYSLVSLLTRLSVPIVPNWNWNLLILSVKIVVLVFQSYLTGIEIRLLMVWLVSVMRSNRT